MIQLDFMAVLAEWPALLRGAGFTLGLSAAAGVFAGVHPQLAAGGSLTFDMRPRDHFDVRLGALITHAPAIRFEEGSVASTLAAGRVDLCWGTTPQRVRLRGWCRPLLAPARPRR